MNKRLIRTNDDAAAGASFNTVLYTGNGGTQSITGVGFQPDFTWIKSRSTDFHQLTDSVRGVNKNLFSNSTLAEYTESNTIQSFDSNGFTLGSEERSNGLGINFVAWNWKAAEIPAINSNGSIPSVVSANPAAGFSIVSYTGNGSAITVGHGLDSAPEWIITKRRDGISNWETYVDTLGPTKYIVLDEINSEIPTTAAAWNNTAPTSSVFSIGSSFSNNRVAYCFHSVPGFSKFGSYTGNGLPLGPTITTGFEPAFVMIKRTDTTGDWFMFDNKRNPTNNRNKFLIANSSGAEVTGSATDYVSFNADNFKLTDSPAGLNGSGGTYIYMAFANQF